MRNILLLTFCYLSFNLNAQVFLGSRLQDVFDSPNKTYDLKKDYTIGVQDSLFIISFPSQPNDTINVGTVLFCNTTTSIVVRQVFMYKYNREYMVKTFSSFMLRYKHIRFVRDNNDCYFTIEP